MRVFFFLRVVVGRRWKEVRGKKNGLLSCLSFALSLSWSRFLLPSLAVIPASSISFALLWSSFRTLRKAAHKIAKKTARISKTKKSTTAKKTYLSVGKKQPVERHEHGLPDDLADVSRGRGHAGGRGGAPLDPELGEPEGEGAALRFFFFLKKERKKGT